MCQKEQDYRDATELAEEAPGGRGGGQIEDLLVPVTVRPEHLDVGGRDLIRAAGDLLRERHQGALTGRERGLGGIRGDPHHRRRIEHLVGQHAPVRQGTVGASERAGGAKRRELVAPNREIALNGTQ